MKKRYVVIYDNPSEDFEQTLGEKLCGDLNVSTPLLTDFLRSAVNVCLFNGLDAVLKPKYAMSRYPKFYGDLIKSMVTDARGKVRVLDPYVKQDEIVRSALLTINFPHTSSKALSEALGVASVFFFLFKMAKRFLLQMVVTL